ncbi:MAG: class I SAM-dependent methyltransferase [Promethearchaeota archaeon]
MPDWKIFFEDYVKKRKNKDLLTQVGKTVGGVPIKNKQFEALILDISEKLNLNKNDILLDLCCGNGVVTEKFSEKCKKIIGLEFSETLINIAKKKCTKQNITYVNMDIRSLNKLKMELKNKISKVLLYDALAYFNPKELYDLLIILKSFCQKNTIMLIGSVLDKDLLWNYFNTTRRKINYILKIKLLKKKVGLGKWWKKSEIEKICEQLSLKYEFLSQDPNLHTAHYRYDVLIYF